MISHSPGWGLSLWPHSAWLSRTAPEHTDMSFPNIWASFEQVTNVTMIGMELPKYNNVKITLTRTPSLHWGKIHQFSLSSYLCPIASMSWHSQLLLLSCNGSKRKSYNLPKCSMGTLISDQSEVHGTKWNRNLWSDFSLKCVFLIGWPSPGRERRYSGVMVHGVLSPENPRMFWWLSSHWNTSHEW